MELNPVILHEDGSGLTIADALIMLKDMPGRRMTEKARGNS